ncbi:ABC transporter permease [Thalassolituus sp. LLYu03]|uniref:ABC transporter permease n=1 Tax=Thalassolituus sp. LLYu03 TaxID=3421656 RepID=UPI003D2E4B96
MIQRSSWQIMADTVFALMIRELRTRFGASRLGYFWAIAEPALQTSVMVVVFSALGRNTLSDVPVALFMLTGILPYKLFSKLLTQLGAAVQSNRGLLSYRQVVPFDPFLTRLIIELATFLIVYFILIAVLAWLGMSALPNDFLHMIVATLLLILCAFGFGMILCVVQLYWEDVTKLVTIVMTPMMFVSGVFYSASMVPEQYWYLLTWNPIFHAVELSRDAYFSSYVTPIGSWLYLAVCALVCMAGGVIAFRLNRQRFVES